MQTHPEVCNQFGASSYTNTRFFMPGRNLLILPIRHETPLYVRLQHRSTFHWRHEQFLDGCTILAFIRCCYCTAVIVSNILFPIFSRNLTLTFKMARNSSFSNATMTFVIAPIIFNKHFQHY